MNERDIHLWMMSYFSKYNDPAELSENLLGPILII